MKLPENTSEQYWHCRAMHKGRNNIYAEYDLCFSNLLDIIVIPYISFQEIIIGGQRFKNRDDIEQIIIRWTPKDQKSYPEKNYYNGYFTIFTSSENHCFESGKDFTGAILTRPKKEERRIESTTPPLVNIVNANDNNNTNINVNTLQIHAKIMASVEELRDVFDEFRLNFTNATDSEKSSMKEIQDSLDGINSNSINQEVSGALAKLKRFMKKAADETKDLGIRIAVSAAATEALKQIRTLYDSIVQGIG